MSYPVTLGGYVSEDGDASGHPTLSEPDPAWLVPSTPASWRRHSARTPLFVFYYSF